MPEKFRQAKKKGQTAPGAAASDAPVRHDEGLWLAVLPFKSSGDAELASFADGLGEEITTGLSRFRYLSVVPNVDLGARYALEGSLRQGGSAIRESAPIVDVETGARLWAETYNRDLQAS